MARYSKMKFPDFREWLMFDQMFEKRTATVYICHLRRVIEGVPSIDQDSINAYFQPLYKENKSACYARRAAWIKFCKWSKEEKGITLPQVELRGEDEGFEPLPKEVDEVIFWLVTKRTPDGSRGLKMPVNTLQQMKWSHVGPLYPSFNGRMVKDPTSSGNGLMFKKEWIEVLERYADPQGDQAVPLIPASPGGLDPYPIRGLKLAYKRHKRSLSQS